MEKRIAGHNTLLSLCLECVIAETLTMEEMNMSQKQLSELMGCSQQYVSKVLKGQENLSLETISKI